MTPPPPGFRGCPGPGGGGGSPQLRGHQAHDQKGQQVHLAVVGRTRRLAHPDVPPVLPFLGRSGPKSHGRCFSGPSLASSPASRSPVSRTARATGDTVTSFAIAVLSADRRFSPYLYPSGTRDCRSWAILEPVDYPKCLRSAPKRPRSRSQGQIRSRGLLSGPPDRPPNRP